MNKKITIVFATIFSCFVFCACGSSNSIVGEWCANLGGEVKTIEYKNDGTYTVTNESGAVEEDGTYEIEGDKLTFTSVFKIDGDKRLNLQEDSDDVLSFKIKGDTLIMTIKSGDSMTFTRK